MLTDYRGPANSKEIFKFLVGERITAAFMGNDGRPVIVLESGMGISFGSVGGECGPSYWPVSKEDVQREVAKRKEAIERGLAELRDLPGAELP